MELIHSLCADQAFMTLHRWTAKLADAETRGDAIDLERCRNAVQSATAEVLRLAMLSETCVRREKIVQEIERC